MRLIEADVKPLCRTCFRSSGLSSRYRGSNTILCSSFSQVENADTCSKHTGWMMLIQNKRMSITPLHFKMQCVQIYKTCRIFCGSNNGGIVTFGWITSLTFYLIYFFKAEVSLSSLGFSPLFPEACLWSDRSGAPAVKPSEEMIHFFLHTQQDGPVFKGMEIQQLWCVILLIFSPIQCNNFHSENMAFLQLNVRWVISETLLIFEITKTNAPLPKRIG